jgi:hypothetical protein
MTGELIKKILDKIYPLLILEDIILHKHRKTMIRFLLITNILLGILVFLDSSDKNLTRGLFLVSIALSLFFVCLDAYFHSFYSRSYEKNNWIPFEIGEILYYSDEKDITKGFIFSDIGDSTLRSLGIEEDEITDFLRDKSILSYEDVFAYQDPPTTLESYIDIIIKNDKKFGVFMKSKGINKEGLTNALEHQIDLEKTEMMKEVWWSKEALRDSLLIARKFLSR